MAWAQCSSPMLRDPSERFRLIAETISEVFWMATPDLSRVFYVSPAYERLWGRSVESVYRDPRSFLDAIHPDDRQRIARSVDERRDGRAFDHEYRIIHADGSIRWIWGRGASVRDADGAVAYHIGIAQDITRRRQIEAELAATAERFGLVSRATNDGIWDWDMTTNTAWWSEAYFTVFGFDRATTPSYEAWAACVHPDDRARVLASFERVIARAEHAWSDEYRFIKPDGAMIDVYDRAYVLHDDRGKPIRMVGAMMDITARRLLETQLRHAQKMEAIGQLAGGIAHDFNNMLQAATLELAMAAETSELPAKVADHIAHSRVALDRAASLTRQLLVFSRREAMRPRRIDLNAKLVDLARMLRRMIGEHIALQLDLAPGSIPIDADPAMIDQVLLNLAVNARDAMPRGGTLAVTTSVGDMACLVVRDTGGGIPAEHLPRIFEPFFTTKEPSAGTGLGLATVHAIVEQHRGRIEVASELANGTTFRIYLPVAGALDADGGPIDSAERVSANARGNEMILLVEDDASVRRSLRLLLEEAGYRIIEAERGAAALATVDASGPAIDLVLTDLVMPDGMSGRDLAVQITSKYPDTEIVFITGFSRDFGYADLEDEHALLHKPVDPKCLLATLRTALDRKALKRS
jgi:PAS domain S-box-containing protein